MRKAIFDQVDFCKWANTREERERLLLLGLSIKVCSTGKGHFWPRCERRGGSEQSDRQPLEWENKHLMDWDYLAPPGQGRGVIHGRSGSCTLRMGGITQSQGCWVLLLPIWREFPRLWRRPH